MSGLVTRTRVYCNHLSALPYPITSVVNPLIVTPNCLKDILAVRLYSKRVVHGTNLYIENIRVATSVIPPLSSSDLATHVPILVLDYSGLRHSLELVKLCKA
mgnify:CR=1 FL=1